MGPAPGPRAGGGKGTMPLRSKLLLGGEVLLLLAAVVVAMVDSTAADWSPPGLFAVLLALAIGSDLVALRHESQRISGAFIAIVLAMALLGPAPAAAIGVLSVLVDELRARNPAARLITNLAAYATFPLIGGLLISQVSRAADLRPDDVGFSLLVLGAFMVANVLNFVIIAGDYAFHQRVSLARQFRAIFLPVLPSVFISAVLTALVAAAYEQVGFISLALLAVVMATFQYLLRELLRSQDRARRLAALQLGVLTSLIETLGLRDQMTARHSAAVARYARAAAAAIGLAEAEQELAHTAGLLHDIGKFAFPDSILLADSQLSEDDWQIVRRHPADGARLVSRMDGYGQVADIILCHHERWDGGGYPRALAGEDIPLLARLLAVADTYDVLTARDSYRHHVDSRAAVQELRRVAGSQFDPALVEAFAALLQREGLSFQHGNDADFDAELAFETRVRDYARPPGGGLRLHRS
jgi:putative nucleotidyltransferase with HDIG domain